MKKAKIILLVIQLAIVLIMFLGIGSSFIPGMEYIDNIFSKIQEWLDTSVWSYLIFIIFNFGLIIILFIINWAVRRLIFEIKFRKKYGLNWKERFKNFV